MTDGTALIFPHLGQLYQALAPWTEALLRVVVGLALVPHGLRNTLGLWPNSGVRSHNVTELAQQLENDGYRPGKFWLEGDWGPRPESGSSRVPPEVLADWRRQTSGVTSEAQ